MYKTLLFAVFSAMFALIAGPAVATQPSTQKPPELGAPPTKTNAVQKVAGVTLTMTNFADFQKLARFNFTERYAAQATGARNDHQSFPGVRNGYLDAMAVIRYLPIERAGVITGIRYATERGREMAARHEHTVTSLQTI